MTILFYPRYLKALLSFDSFIYLLCFGLFCLSGCRHHRPPLLKSYVLSNWDIYQTNWIVTRFSLTLFSLSMALILAWAQLDLGRRLRSGIIDSTLLASSAAYQQMAHRTYGQPPHGQRLQLGKRRSSSICLTVVLTQFIRQIVSFNLIPATKYFHFKIQGLILHFIMFHIYLRETL